ncbi:MAG: hypothetical protein SFW62_09550 [Alphaproteobacteria bacterium]|nr:hypothetical protein [Alphaproteobacteria bacterium]
MNQHLIFALAAIVLAAVRYGTYFHTIYKGKTKPHAFSWLLWGMVTAIATFAQFDLHGGPSVWALAFVAATCLLIGILALFIGDRDYTKSDWIALVFSFMAIPVWKATQNPLAAIFMVMVIDSLSYWPTIRKSFNKPQTEPPISYGFAGLRYFLMLFAVPDPTWESLMYPFFLMALDWGVAIYLVIRRAQLGYPLHEYARKKRA